VSCSSAKGASGIVTPGVLEVERRHEVTLIKAMARAFWWQRILESGRFSTITELAAAEKINASYVHQYEREVSPVNQDNWSTGDRRFAPSRLRPSNRVSNSWCDIALLSSANSTHSDLVPKHP
jgi:hypothetical protein